MAKTGSKQPKKNKPKQKKPAAKQVKKAEKNKPEKKGGEKVKLHQEALQELIARGKPRGFVTDNEILYHFPKIEEDIDFLEEVYDQLEKSGVKVVETGGLIDTKEEATQGDLENSLAFEGDVPDAVQQYLKEIGKTPLLTKDEEKDLA